MRNKDIKVHIFTERNNHISIRGSRRTEPILTGTPKCKKTKDMDYVKTWNLLNTTCLQYSTQSKESNY